MLLLGSVANAGKSVVFRLPLSLSRSGASFHTYDIYLYIDR